jgi:hypothetical protein
LGTIASTGSCCCTFSACRCRAIGASDSNPCAINEIDFADGEFTIGSINQIDHLLLGE